MNSLFLPSILSSLLLELELSLSSEQKPSSPRPGSWVALHLRPLEMVIMNSTSSSSVSTLKVETIWFPSAELRHFSAQQHNGNFILLHTLVYQIEVQACLLILKRNSRLHSLILVCTFIILRKIFPLHSNISLNC